MMTKDDVAVLGQRVLVIDDDDAVMTSIAHIVKHHGFEPVTASDWVEALEAIEEQRPEVVLLDLNMPHVDGVALLKFIRNRELTIPVIVVSAFIDEDSRASLTKLGVSAFVAKPFTMAELNAQIQRALGTSEPATSTEALGHSEVAEQEAEAQLQDVETEDKKRRRARIRRRKRELRKPKMKPQVLLAVAASCVALAVLLGVLNFYLSH